MNIFRVQQLFFVMMTMQSLSLHSMEIIEKPQKERIENFICRKTVSVTGSQAWNKDCSKCAWVTFDNNAPHAKSLQLTVVGLVDNGKHVVSNIRSWQDFYFPVFADDVRPCFDKDGRACFYGYGNKEGKSDLEFNFVGEYSIDVDGTAEHCECIFHIRSCSMKYDYFRRFAELLNFPVLIKALLQSTKVFKREFKDGWRKAFCPEPSNFPKDFKMYKEHLGLEKLEDKQEVDELNQYESYYDLPMKVRAAFEVQSW